MWPEGLRHPFGFERPLSSPKDYAGETIRSSKSHASTMLFNALGAKTSPVEPNAETMAGVQGEFVLSPNGIAVANVTFFPKVNLLYANADTYAGLTDEQRSVLADAAVATRSAAERHHAQGIAYLTFARTRPGHFDVMFRRGLFEPDDAYREVAARTFAILNSALPEKVSGILVTFSIRIFQLPFKMVM